MVSRIVLNSAPLVVTQEWSINTDYMLENLEYRALLCDRMTMDIYSLS